MQLNTLQEQELRLKGEDLHLIIGLKKVLTSMKEGLEGLAMVDDPEEARQNLLEFFDQYIMLLFKQSEGLK